MSWLPLPNGKALLVAALLALFAWLAVSNWGYRKDLRLTDKKLMEQKKTVDQQAGVITTLQTQDAQNRALMAAQQQHEQRLRQQGDIYQRKYREAIKDNPCAAERMPDAVIGLLRPTTAGKSTGGDVAP
jgi:preprotein translocase subunit SecD